MRARTRLANALTSSSTVLGDGPSRPADHAYDIFWRLPLRVNRDIDSPENAGRFEPKPRMQILKTAVIGPNPIACSGRN
jgi:hypothetical protein